MIITIIMIMIMTMIMITIMIIYEYYMRKLTEAEAEQEKSDQCLKPVKEDALEEAFRLFCGGWAWGLWA